VSGQARERVEEEEGGAGGVWGALSSPSPSRPFSPFKPFGPCAPPAPGQTQRFGAPTLWSGTDRVARRCSTSSSAVLAMPGGNSVDYQHSAEQMRSSWGSGSRAAPRIIAPPVCCIECVDRSNSPSFRAPEEMCSRFPIGAVHWWRCEAARMRRIVVKLRWKVGMRCMRQTGSPGGPGGPRSGMTAPIILVSCALSLATSSANCDT
jgi:hypothetical protein